MPESKATSRFVLVVAAAVGLIVSFWGGTPNKLPGVALGSDLILYVERGIAGFFAALVLAIIAVRAWAGHLPSELNGRGVKYVSREAAEASRDETRDAIREVLEAQDLLDQRVALLEEARPPE